MYDMYMHVCTCSSVTCIMTSLTGQPLHKEEEFGVMPIRDL